MVTKYQTSLPKQQADRFDEYLKTQEPKFTSEILRNIVIDFLDNLKPLSYLQKATPDNPFLDERFKCRITGIWAMVRDLPCVTDTDMQCRDERCQAYIKKRLGLS